MLQTVSATCTPTVQSTAISRGWVCEVETRLPNLLTRILAKHPRGRYGSRTTHRLLPLWHRFRLSPRYTHNQRPCCAVGRTRGFGHGAAGQ